MCGRQRKDLKERISALWDLYKTIGNDRRFQHRCVKDLQPLTDIFCRRSNLPNETWGELRSYLWYGYFYTFENYERMTKISLWTALWGTSQRRMLDFIRRKTSEGRKFQETPTEIKDRPTEQEEKKDNTMNEILVERMLKEAGIVGLDYEIFVRKKGLFGYRPLSDVEILRFFGIRKSTLVTSNRRTQKRLCEYRKLNTDDYDY